MTSRGCTLFLLVSMLIWSVGVVHATETDDLAAIRDLAEEVRTTEAIPGLALGLIDGGETLLAEGFGSGDSEGEAPVTADTVFAIGSATKAFTATLVGLLVDDGLLDWDVPVRAYLPGFAMKDPVASERISVRDLLTHRTGLPRHNLLFSVTPFSRQELVARLCCIDPSTDLRVKFQYTNLGYAVAGVLVGQRVGSSWEEALHDRLLAPLGLNQTYLSAAAAQRQAQTADGHWLQEGRLVPASAESTGAIAPAGALYSSVRDMLRWLRFNLEGGRVGARQLISVASLRQIHSPQMVVADQPIQLLMTHAVAPHLAYGFGWYVQVYRGRVTLHHGGRRDGFSAFVSMTPDLDRGIVLLANRHGVTGQLASLARTIEDQLLHVDDVDWKAVRMSRLRQLGSSRRLEEAVANETGARQVRRPLADYAGTYDNSGYGSLRIEAGGEDLRFEYYRLRGLASHVHDEVFSSSGGDVTVVLTFLAEDGVPPTAVAVPLEPKVAPIVFTRRP